MLPDPWNCFIHQRRSGVPSQSVWCLMWMSGFEAWNGEAPHENPFLFFFGNPQNHITFPICLVAQLSHLTSRLGLPSARFQCHFGPTRGRVQLLLPRDHPSWNPWEHTCSFWKNTFGSATFLGRISFWRKHVEIHFVKVTLLGVKCQWVEGKLLGIGMVLDQTCCEIWCKCVSFFCSKQELEIIC